MSFHVSATKTNLQPVYIQTGALGFYKQTTPVARSLIRRRPTNPIKSPFVPSSVFVWRREEQQGWREVTGGLSLFPCELNAAKCRYHAAASGTSNVVTNRCHIQRKELRGVSSFTGTFNSCRYCVYWAMLKYQSENLPFLLLISGF